MPLSELVITHELLERLSKRTSLPDVGGPIVLFGFRGVLPMDVSNRDFQKSHAVRVAAVDNVHMRCTIGQWQPGDRQLALFLGSTVPSLFAIRRQLQRIQPANMLSLGHFAYAKGVHKQGKPSGHRAFRQNAFFPVWRSFDDEDFDAADQLDLGQSSDSIVFDNLHCAYVDNPSSPGFSSNGCQVVCGQPMSAARGNAPEVGPWKTFISNAYDGAGSQQAQFQYSLYSSFDLTTVSNRPDSELQRLLRFGSTGCFVRAAQVALLVQIPYLEVDGHFGRNTLEAVLRFQRAKGLTADGIVGPGTAEALELDWPNLTVSNPA